MWGSRVRRAVAGWMQRVWDRRRERLASFRHADEQLVDLSHRLRDSGESYDTWRRALPAPRRGGPLP